MSQSCLSINKFIIKCKNTIYKIQSIKQPKKSLPNNPPKKWPKKSSQNRNKNHQRNHPKNDPKKSPKKGQNTMMKLYLSDIGKLGPSESEFQEAAHSTRGGSELKNPFEDLFL